MVPENDRALFVDGGIPFVRSSRAGRLGFSFHANLWPDILDDRIQLLSRLVCGSYAKVAARQDDCREARSYWLLLVFHLSLAHVLLHRFQVYGEQCNIVLGFPCNLSCLGHCYV